MTFKWSILVGSVCSIPSLTAGLAYFAMVFAIGFVLGLIRIAFLVPLFGDLTAVLIELPIILTLAWRICRKLVSSMNVPLTIGSRAVMGGLALVLLQSAELALSTIVFGNSILDHLRSYLSLAHALGLAGQFAFGLFPLIQMGLSTRADVTIPSALDAFIANPNVRERFSITVRAPASIVYKIASEFDMQSLVLVRLHDVDFLDIGAGLVLVSSPFGGFCYQRFDGSQNANGVRSPSSFG